MALNLSIPVTQDLSPRITVIGVGGAQTMPELPAILAEMDKHR